MTDKSLGTTRTADYTASVVSSRGECSGRLMAGGLGSAAVVLQGPAGLVTLPVGFASSGVVVAGSSSAAAAAGATGAAGGGGVGTGVIVAGVGAVAGGVALAVAKKGDGGSGGNMDPTASCSGGGMLAVVQRSSNTLTLQWSLASPSGCYTVDYLTGISSCSQFPPHNSILPVQGTSVTLSGLTPSTAYHIHVHPYQTCGGSLAPGSSSVVFVNTLSAGSASQPVSSSDYQTCCGSS